MRGHLLFQNICLTVLKDCRHKRTVHVMNFDWFPPITSTQRDALHKKTTSQVIQLGFINVTQYTN